MAGLGELFESADYAFAFRTLEPRPEAPRALLVLLHGVEGGESELVDLADDLPADGLVVFPHGYRAIRGGRCGWYRVGLSADGLQVVADEEREAREKLVEFLAQLQEHFAIAPQRTVVAGFSQGGMLALAAALTAPGCMGAAAVLCGRLIDEVDVDAAARGSFGDLEVLLVHGRDDETLPLADAKRTAARLGELGIAHQMRIHDGGHELTGPMRQDTRGWLRRALAR